MTMSVIFILIIIFLALAAIFSSGIKREFLQEGGDMMKKAYVYLVLFATLMMSIGGSVAAFMAITDIVAPSPYYQTYEEFRQGGAKFENNNTDNMSEDEIMTRYQAMVEGERERQISRAKNSLIKSLGWIVIPLPVFLLFQRKLVREEL
ncbi:MAG: hypothetical protein PHF24_10210 [Syntrophomonas sp.]|nr:hypothetical protein [Syntrophomonas sp.]